MTAKAAGAQLVPLPVVLDFMNMRFAAATGRKAATCDRSSYASTGPSSTSDTNCNAADHSAIVRD